MENDKRQTFATRNTQLYALLFIMVTLKIFQSPNGWLKFSAVSNTVERGKWGGVRQGGGGRDLAFSSRVVTGTVELSTYERLKLPTLLHVGHLGDIPVS